MRLCPGSVGKKNTSFVSHPISFLLGSLRGSPILGSIRGLFLLGSLRGLFLHAAIIILCLPSGQLRAIEVLSNEAAFYRCYGHFTSARPDPSNPLIADVRRGGKTFIQACMQVLRSAAFTAAPSRTSNPNSKEVQNVLRTFHLLHFSWFDKKAFPQNSGNDVQSIFNYGVYDVSSPAGYLTYVLFKPSTAFSEVLTSSSNLRIVRTNDDPSRSIATFTPYPLDKTNYAFTGAFKLAGVGPLIGVEPSGNPSWSFAYSDYFAYNNSNVPRSGSIRPFNHLGGGILGNPTYLLQTVEEEDTFQADGATKLTRKWARSAMHDLLCRSLPMVRVQDTLSYVISDSSTEFRKSLSCTQCHVTMDQMAGVNRNFRYVGVAGLYRSTPQGGGYFPSTHAVTQPADRGWLSEVDPVFHQRPPRGVLYFRDLEGNLVERDISSIADLGQKLADLDDPYICAAKRYYEYFMQVALELDDPGVRLYSKTERLHLDRVKELGRKLRAHQNVQKLIEEIISLPDYARSDFGHGGK